MELRINGLTKTYGATIALQGVDLTMSEGIYGLLGPKGAGKSTLMNILTGNLTPTAGVVTFDGIPIQKMGAAYREKLGYMPQQQAMYPAFTVRRFLSYMAALRGMSRADASERIAQVLEQVELTAVSGKRISTLSGGMKQRLLIAQAILADPAVLILDEPTAGLDPKQRIVIRNLIASLALHKIVIIATHVVADVEYIAKEIILLHHGSVLCSATRDAMVAELQGKVLEVRVPETVLEDITAQYKVGSIAKESDGIYVRLLSEVPPPGLDWTEVRPNLEDVYLWHFAQ